MLSCLFLALHTAVEGYKWRHTARQELPFIQWKSLDRSEGQSERGQRRSPAAPSCCFWSLLKGSRDSKWSMTGIQWSLFTQDSAIYPWHWCPLWLCSGTNRGKEIENVAQGNNVNLFMACKGCWVRPADIPHLLSCHWISALVCNTNQLLWGVVLFNACVCVCLHP